MGWESRADFFLSIYIYTLYKIAILNIISLSHTNPRSKEASRLEDVLLLPSLKIKVNKRFTFMLKYKEFYVFVAKTNINILFFFKFSFRFFVSVFFVFSLFSLDLCLILKIYSLKILNKFSKNKRFFFVFFYFLEVNN